MAAVSSVVFGQPTFRFPLLPNQSRRYRYPFSRKRFSTASASMDSGGDLTAKFLEFPYVTAPHRNLMMELLSSVETRLGSSLQRCTLPSDVQQFENASGTARACLNLRAGLPSSQIDFVLGSWINCELPSGGALNITSLSAYLKPITDAPHFLLELIRSSPTSLVLVLDLTPRKDLIMYPDYLKYYYEDTQLDEHRQRLHNLPGVRPYISPSLYIRAVLSPTAIIVSIDGVIDDIIEDHISPVTKGVLQFWIDSCACLERPVVEPEKAYVAERDRVIKNQTIEVDLGSNFPRLFGQDVAGRILGFLKEYYNK